MSWLYSGTNRYEYLEELMPYLQDGQNPAITLSVYNKVRAIMFSSERLMGIFHQFNLLLCSSMVFTHERIIFFRPRIWGGYDIEDYYWKFCGMPFYREGPLFATWWVQGPPGLIGLNMMPKRQARKAFNYASAIGIWWGGDEWRFRMYDELRAKSGGVILQGTLARMNTQAFPNPYDPYKLWAFQVPSVPKDQPGVDPKTPAVSLAQTTRYRQGVELRPTSENRYLQDRQAAHKATINPTEKLNKLKTLLDQGLISREEFDAKRAQILDMI